VEISRIMAALPIAATLYVALPTTSDAQGWVWRAGKWVYEIAKDSKALAPALGAGAGSVTTGTLFGGNAKATDNNQIKLEAQRCLSDDLCRQSLGLRRQAPASKSPIISVGSPEEQELFLRRFNAAPPGSAAERLLNQK